MKYLIKFTMFIFYKFGYSVTITKGVLKHPKYPNHKIEIYSNNNVGI